MYQSFGGVTDIHTLIDHSYDLVKLEPQYQALRQIHDEDMALIREKLHKSFNGRLGGPQLFAERYGYPQLRARHIPFAVNIQVRNEQMACFIQAVSELDIGKTLAEPVLIQIFVVADWCRNQNGDGTEPPMPPMAADPQVCAPRLQQTLGSYGVNSFFKELTSQGCLKLLR